MFLNKPKYSLKSLGLRFWHHMFTILIPLFWPIWIRIYGWLVGFPHSPATVHINS